MKYCFRCGNQFRDLYSLDRHLDKKKTCKIKYLKISPELLKGNYEKYYMSFISMNYKFGDNKTEDKYRKCEYCGKKFQHRSSYYRHIKEYCKKVNKKTEKQDELEKKIIEYGDRIELELDRIKKRLKKLEDRI